MRGGRKVLSGADLVAIFQRFGSVIVGGSKHIRLRRITSRIAVRMRHQRLISKDPVAAMPINRRRDLSHDGETDTGSNGVGHRKSGPAHLPIPTWFDRDYQEIDHA